MLITVSDDSSDDSEQSVEEIIAKETLSKQGKSWVYEHAEKRQVKGVTHFFCLVEINKTGKKRTRRYEAKDGATSSIAKHLRKDHFLKPAKKVEQMTLDNFKIQKQNKEKTFREAYAELVVKQYLPFSLIQEKVLQESYISFYKEFSKTKVQPLFVTDKTVAADIAIMADRYVEAMKAKFKSKLSLCMDVWTGPNKMSFLGMTFTYLDDNFTIQRGLLDMVKMNKKHSGKYIAKLFQRTMDLYSIDKDMVGGVTQDNASNCGTCVDALVEKGYDRDIFYGCFLHVLNLACQAAIEVYDPTRKKKTSRIRLAEDVEDFSGSEDSHDEEDPDYEHDDYEEELKDVKNLSNAILNVSSFLFIIGKETSCIHQS